MTQEGSIEQLERGGLACHTGRDTSKQEFNLTVTQYGLERLLCRVARDSGRRQRQQRQRRMAGCAKALAPGVQSEQKPLRRTATRKRNTMTHSDFHQVSEAAIEAKVFELLANRREGATICPSEVARSLLPNHGPWRELMPQIRQVAQTLVQTNRLTVTRGGARVDATSPGGPIRLGRPTRAS